MRWQSVALLVPFLPTCFTYVTKFETTAGSSTATYEEALLTSAKLDLACDGVGPPHQLTISHPARGSAVMFDAVDGCGRRALYAQECAGPSLSRDGSAYTLVCKPQLFGSLELSRAQKG